MRLTAAAAVTKKAGKVYRLKRGIPMDSVGKGRAILVSISRHRGATANTIRKDMKRGFSDATLRFYLGKFQRERVVVA